MRILYVALDQTVPGTLGGSVHVQAVAEGLAALGHDVHAAVTRGGDWPQSPVVWHDVRPPAGAAALRWMRRGAMEALARQAGAQVIIERYYNFGGEGVLAARALGVPAVLEVNAPIVDYPGSRKRTLDRLLIVEPMRRWREHICRQTDLFVTPARQILPDWIDPARVLETEWGADTERFRPVHAVPDESATSALTALPVTCVFAGAFRAWHGAVRLAETMARLHASGDHRFGARFIGDGPERVICERAAAGAPNVVFTGALPHDQMPMALAAAGIGVAPFEIDRHAALRLGFYWSPLKIFEYMASGLPVVAPRLPRIQQLVEDGREGVLYDPTDPQGLDRAIISLADPRTRRRMGTAARDRAVRDFSWRAHCAKLDERLRQLGT